MSVNVNQWPSIMYAGTVTPGRTGILSIGGPVPATRTRGLGR